MGCLQIIDDRKQNDRTSKIDSNLPDCHLNEGQTAFMVCKADPRHFQH